MKDSNSTHSQGSAQAESHKDTGFAPWKRLKSKRISYLTLPLLIMATITEFVILATGWKYQQTVCLPKGMGVTFFHIGPIGATILAVELLKLPLAIWTASRRGWVKGFMLCCGLPLICVLTFQLVKDMAVYEMGVAMKPASEYLDKASTEEVKISQLKGELAAIEGKKTNREQKLAELAARKAKAKSEFEEALKQNEVLRQDAISLTDYQKKELSQVEARQATIIKQCNEDTEKLNKALADLHARREVEVVRASKWNAEEARIENDYKVAMGEYTNKKNAYEKAMAAYENANFLKRQLMKKPVDPGVPPVRESNTILKPTAIAQIDAQIKAKEAELAAVNKKRRDSVAQVSEDAHQLRAEFDRRSTNKREDADKKRDALLAAQAASDKQFAAEQKEIDQEFETAAQKVDGIRAEIDDHRKKAEGYYEAREESIKNTQVHRIATTVEIVRGILFGKHPVSVTATAKERGDIYTDQISMVRISVYPVLAFIVAFLPTLMVEIGFSTVFESEEQRPKHRLGFLGRRMHALYTRAGRFKMLRAERLANEANASIASRDRALATAQQALDLEKAASEQALAGKDIELQAARESMQAAAAQHEEQLKRQAAEHEEQLLKTQDEHKTNLKKKEQQWVAKFTDLADSLNRAVQEKDALRDLQKSEVERQIQMRQNAWQDRLGQLRKELDDQRTAAETERTTLMQEHQKKLLEVTEDCKTQVIQARRQMADAELAAVEKNAKLSHELKEALHARDAAEAQLKHQTDALGLRLSQAEEDAARALEKVAREEKHRLERQRLEFEKALRQKDEEHAHRWNHREQELSLQFDSRLAEEKSKVEQEARERQAELEEQFDARTRAVEARWGQELQKREELAQARFRQREQQLQAQADIRFRDAQADAAEQLRSRELEFEHKLDAQAREAETRLTEQLQEKDLAFHAQLKQREQEFASRAAARETELQNQWASKQRTRQEEWERQSELRVRAAEARVTQAAQQREEQFQSQLRQRDEQWQVKTDTVRSELQAQNEQVLRRRDADAESNLRDLESRLRKEAQQKVEAAQAEARQREQSLAGQLTAEAQARHAAAEEQWKQESEQRLRAAVAPFKELLAHAEKERDEARDSAAEAQHHVQSLEKKLTEASSFLSGWRNGNGKTLTVANRQ